MADVDPGDVEELSLYDSNVKPFEKPAKKPRISEVGDDGVLVESKIEAEKEDSVENVKSGNEENDEQKVPEWSLSSVKERVEVNPNPFMLIPQLTESDTEYESDEESVDDILEAIGELKPNDILFYCDASDSEEEEVEIEFCEVRNTVMIFEDSDVEE